MASPMAIKLITLAQLRAYTRVDFPDDDVLLDELIQMASGGVLDYLKPKGWVSFFDGSVLTAEVPPTVRMATAHLARAYYDDGLMDNVDRDFAVHGELPHRVVSLLYRLRDPALC